MIIVVFLAVIAVIAVYAVGMYNGLVKLRESVKQAWSNIDVLLVQRHDELPKLFNLAQLFVMPSFFEGFGLTLLEAMACGCPAVVSETGACSEVGGDAALTADPNDPADFAEKIISVLGDEAKLQDLRQKSLDRAAFFNWERSARLTIEGLKKAAGKL